MLRRLLASVSVVLAVVSGCTPMVQSNVTTFHQLSPNSVKGRTLAVLPHSGERQPSLEFATYRKVLEGRFAQQGFVVVDRPESADVIAFVSFGIDGGTTQTSLMTMPEFGQTGGGMSYQSGTMFSPTVGSVRYSGTSYSMPTYRVTGYSPMAVTSERYARHLVIDIVDRASVDSGKPVKLYEGKLVSSGSCSSFASVFDALVAAMFENWPGESGRARTINTPSPGDC